MNRNYIGHEKAEEAKENEENIESTTKQFFGYHIFSSQHLKLEALQVLVCVRVFAVSLLCFCSPAI